MSPCAACVEMSLKEALEFLVRLAKTKKKEEQRDHGKDGSSLRSLVDSR